MRRKRWERIGLIIVSTPGTKSPFQFLDRFWPPAVAAKKAVKKAAVEKPKMEVAGLFPTEETGVA